MHIPGQADKIGISTGTSSGDNQERLATFHQEYHKQFKHPVCSIRDFKSTFVKEKPFRNEQKQA